MDMKRRQTAMCLGGRGKKLVVDCTLEGREDEEPRLSPRDFGHVCGWWYSLHG